MRHQPTAEELIIKDLDAQTQSTKDMLSVLIQTKELGTDTLKGLEQQGRQLGTVQDEVDNLKFQQDTAKRKVRSIASIFWDIINHFRSDPPIANHNEQVNEQLAKKEAAKKKKAASCCARKKDVKKSPPVDDVVGAALKDAKSKSKYDESEKNLDEMGKVVGELKEIATDMGKEIDTHNTRLDMLKVTTEETDAEMEDISNRVKVMLRK